MFFILSSISTFGFALEPDEILVVANRNATKSVALARYYMEKRGVVKKNLLELRVTDGETLTREDYLNKVAGPVRNCLENERREKNIQCLLLMYGMPLKISGPKNSGKASLDSEIGLVLEEFYPLSGWIPNPNYMGHNEQERKNIFMPDRALFVARLDGPSFEIVKRVIDESMEAEKRGLRGTVYFDARWPLSKNGKGNKTSHSAYEKYDQSIYMAAQNVKKSGIMTVVVNDKQGLFQPGECPDAAIYCGWYSLARYVDAFEWRPGSIGYHIASSECATLKGKDSRVWCKMMLEKGIAATIGPVHEPYVQAFPLPEVFFGLLLEGRLTLAECYSFSLPFLSWQMVLIGDPLYRPFKKTALN